MELHVGVPELLAFSAVLIGGGWTLLKLSLNQFESRLDEKFKTLDMAVQDVKRLELETVRSETRNAQLYVTKADHDKILERIFRVLESMDAKLSNKPDKEEVDQKILRHLPQQ